jgi:uncharacterized hydrophobic protein (TIGR00271 family)
MDLLSKAPSVCNIVYLPGTARHPDGDLILADVAREDTSVILADLRDLDIHQDGSIALETIESSISRVADEAEEAAGGSPADAVVWEEVESSTSESAVLSGSFLVFMTLATAISAMGLFLDEVILLLGGMVVGPEFGPVAGFCVAAVQKRRKLAFRSLFALAVGFPVAMMITFSFAVLLLGVGVVPAEFSFGKHTLVGEIASPDFFSVLVAAFAGVAGILSLTTSKSGPLIGVLISVATIPAAAAASVCAASGEWEKFGTSIVQLLINLALMLIMGTVTLFTQRMLFQRRRFQYLVGRMRGKRTDYD